MDRDPAWSPDGRTIAFVRSLDSLFCNKDDTINVVGADGSGLRSLGYHGCKPMWSPEGSRLAFVSDLHLVVAPVGGDAAKPIADAVFSYDGYDWSPDGLKLVVDRHNGIWVVNADGRGLQRLTRSGYGPRWSPDGSLILHERIDGDAQALWVMRPDGGGARKIVDGEILEPAWSPDGARIAFVRTGAEGGLFVVNRAGRNERRLPVAGGGSFGGWSPDGKRIALGGDTAGTLNRHFYPIVVIDVDTQRASRATQRP